MRVCWIDCLLMWYIIVVLVDFMVVMVVRLLVSLCCSGFGIMMVRLVCIRK